MKKLLIFLLLFSQMSFGQGWFSCITPTETPLNSLKEYNGKLILGGYGTKGKYILSYDGVSFDTIGTTSNYPAIWAMEVYNNELYIGGDFTTINGITVNGIAKYDGNSWYPLGNGINTSNGSSVIAMKVFNGKLYVGGCFSSINGSTHNCIASWNGFAWDSVGLGLNGCVSALGLYQNELYAGGYFTTSGADTVNYIARWDGNLWKPLKKGIVQSGITYVEDIMEFNGDLYIGGRFDAVDGNLTSQNIALWNGTDWFALPMMLTGTVTCLNIYNTKLFIGGFFNDFSLGLNYVASWNGIPLNNLDNGLLSTSSFKQVWCSEVYNNRIYFGGNILGSVHGNILSEGIIAWDEFNSGLEEVQMTDNSINVIPNPVSDIFQLSGDVPVIPYHVQLIDMSGRVILNEVKNDYFFDTSFLKNGVYQLLIDNNTQHRSTRIVKI